MFNFLKLSKDKEDKLKYVSVKSYEDEIRRIDGEIKEINKTIKFYETKRRMLEDFKKVLRNNIKRENDVQACRNCEFYKDKFCLKHETNVNPEADCLQFVWKI